MKTYKSKRHNYKIDLPEHWSCPGFFDELLGRNIFKGHDDEIFNIEIGPLIPEPSLADTEAHFDTYAYNRCYDTMGFSTINVQGKDHFCAKYAIPMFSAKCWLAHKKYCLVFNNIEYAITCTLGITSPDSNELFEAREGLYDTIVSTFKLINTHV